MKAQLYIAAIPFLAAVAFAQDPAPQATTPPKPETTAAPAKQDRPNPAEMKTQNYSGTLMDATCATAGAATPAATASSTAGSDAATASSETEKPKTTSGNADRATTSDKGQACSVSASSSQFALRLKDGQILKFDDVGNQRAQDALKNKKKWSDDAAAQKPIHVSANGVLTGDRLTVVSIH